MSCRVLILGIEGMNWNGRPIDRSLRCYLVRKFLADIYFLFFLFFSFNLIDLNLKLFFEWDKERISTYLAPFFFLSMWCYWFWKDEEWPIRICTTFFCVVFILSSHFFLRSVCHVGFLGQWALNFFLWSLVRVLHHFLWGRTRR